MSAPAKSGKLLTGTRLVSQINLVTGGVSQGVVNIESTQSGVFCNAVVSDDNDVAKAFSIPLVRVNPHPGGTVE